MVSCAEADHPGVVKLDCPCAADGKKFGLIETVPQPFQSPAEIRSLLPLGTQAEHVTKSIEFLALWSLQVKARRDFVRLRLPVRIGETAGHVTVEARSEQHAQSRAQRGERGDLGVKPCQSIEFRRAPMPKCFSPNPWR